MLEKYSLHRANPNTVKMPARKSLERGRPNGDSARSPSGRAASRSVAPEGWWQAYSLAPGSGREWGGSGSGGRWGGGGGLGGLGGPTHPTPLTMGGRARRRLAGGRLLPSNSAVGRHGDG